MRTLKQLLPDLNNTEVVLGEYSVAKTVQQVLKCSEVIRSFKTPPLKYSPYDEIVELLQQEEVFQKKIASAYDDPSLKLIGEYSSVGRGFGVDASTDDLKDNPRARTSIGVAFSIPLGSQKKSTGQVSEKLIENRYKAQALGQLSKITAFHSETADIIGILKDVVHNQKETNKYLGKSLKESRKKYRQARISLQELISEQDSLLQSSISEIDTNLAIINTLMDYFSIYTEIPCELNRI
jgi:outer membrane protein TolC